jgi:hypothetical protein
VLRVVHPNISEEDNKVLDKYLNLTTDTLTRGLVLLVATFFIGMFFTGLLGGLIYIVMLGALVIGALWLAMRCIRVIGAYTGLREREVVLEVANDDVLMLIDEVGQRDYQAMSRVRRRRYELSQRVFDALKRIQDAPSHDRGRVIAEERENLNL